MFNFLNKSFKVFKINFLGSFHNLSKKHIFDVKSSINRGGLFMTKIFQFERKIGAKFAKEE